MKLVQVLTLIAAIVLVVYIMNGVFANYPWICHRCTRPISREITAQNPRHREAWSADHHPVPRSQGGPSELWNLKPAHNGCNSDAGNELKAQAMAEAANPTSQDWGV